MPSDAKTAKKQVQPAAPSPAPQPPVQEVHREIVIPLRIQVGREFKSKLPFLLGLLVLFTFALIMFDKSNFKTTDLSDMQRVQYNMPKLYSLSFILFIILFSLSLALGIYYAIGLGWISSLLVIPVTLIPSLILGLIFFPWLVSPFLALSATISFTAILASFWPKFSISRAWTALSVAMIVFALLAFFVVFYKVAENKDVHVDLFLNSLVAQSQGGSPGTISIPAQVVSSAVSKDDFSSFITQNDVREILLASYPNFASLSDSEKELAIQAFHSKIVELGYDRSIPLWEPTPARLFPRLDPSAVFTDLGNAIGEGIDNALALVGVPPIPRTQAPVTGETPPAEVVETEVLQADMSIEGSSAAVPETEDAGPVDAAEDVELSSVDTTESAEQEEESMDDHTSTSGLVEQDSVDATEPPTTSEGSSSTPSSSTPSSSDESLPEDGNPPSSESSGSDDGEST